MTPSSALVRALVAVALGVLLLSSQGRTMAAWVRTGELGTNTTMAAGGVTIAAAGGPTLHLHSNQPIGSRTYASTTSCTPLTGFKECRVISATVASEALAPGDTVVIDSAFTVTAAGTNLVGNVTIDHSRLINRSASALAAAATVAGTVRAPGDTSAVATVNGQRTVPLSVKSGAGVGNYTVQTMVAIPAANGAARWDTALQNQTLGLTGVNVTFVQRQA